MSDITAVFENGVLRPLSTLELVEGQHVRLQIWPESSTSEAALEEALTPLISDGLIMNPPHLPDVLPISDTDLQRLVEDLKVPVDQPLSDLILDERGDW
jgi:predicted DNA-binding antitoxin AbrB/MazE fold protein